WTLITSSASTLRASSIVRATSTGSEAARRRVPANGSTSPTPTTSGGSPASSSSVLARLWIARRLSRTSPLDCDGAMISTECPREASSPDTRATYWLTSFSASQANGVTCAIARRSTEIYLIGAAGAAWFRGTAPSPSSRRTSTTCSTRWLSRCARALLRGKLALGRGRLGDHVARVLGDERLGQRVRLVIRALVHRRLHQVRAGAVELARQAVVERELELGGQRDVAEGLALQPDVGPLAVGQPRHVVRRADVNVAGGQLMAHDRGDRVGLGDLLGLQPLALEHVVEVH